MATTQKKDNTRVTDKDGNLVQFASDRAGILSGSNNLIGAKLTDPIDTSIVEKASAARNVANVTNANSGYTPLSVSTSGRGAYSPASYQMSSYSQSNASRNADANASNLLNGLQSGASQYTQNGIIDKNAWNAINSKYTQSQTVTDAFNKTQNLLNKINEGKTSYSDKVASLMDTISNREDFSYDPNNDTLFQNALASAMRSGQTAMQDTMGQAAALTGGYGSSYAQAVGNQAYNDYVQSAYDNLPQYYEMALESYNAEGEDLYNQLAMYNQADETEYGRLLNSYDANNSNWQTLYNQDYGQFQDKISNAVNSANLQMGEASNIWGMQTDAYNAAQNNADSLYARDWNAYQDQVSQRQYATNLAEQQAQYSADQAYKYDALTQAQNQYNTDMKYKYDALAQDQAQYESELAFNQAQAAAKTLASDALTDDEIQRIKDLYAQNLRYETINGEQVETGGGDAVSSYLDLIGKNVSKEAIDKLVSGITERPLKYQDWTISKDTMNGWFGLGNKTGSDDGNDRYTYNGETMKFSELKNLAESSGMTDEEINEFLGKLRVQSKN